MTIMAKNAPEYGLENLTPDAPLEYDSIEVTAPTHLALVSDLTDVPVSELVGLNPALLKGIAPANYSLRVPKGTAPSLRASLELIPPERRLSWRMHKVAEGETLASIGKRYGAAANLIAAANKLQFGEPVTGDRLVIPAVYTAPRRVAPQPTTTRRNATQRKPVTHTAQNRARSTAIASR
jgi:membrane-bound lytic murein transglycosylase D